MNYFEKPVPLFETNIHLSGYVGQLIKPVGENKINLNYKDVAKEMFLLVIEREILI